MSITPVPATPPGVNSRDESVPASRALAAWIGPGAPEPGGWWEWLVEQVSRPVVVARSAREADAPPGLTSQEWADLPPYHPPRPE